MIYSTWYYFRSELGYFLGHHDYQFVDALKGLARTEGNRTITVDSAGVTGGLVSCTSANELQFTFQFSVLERNTSNLQLDFGPEVAAAGLSIDGPLPIPIESHLNFSLTFGLDLTPGLTGDQSFFVRPTELALGTEVVATNLTSPAKLAFWPHS